MQVVSVSSGGHVNSWSDAMRSPGQASGPDNLPWGHRSNRPKSCQLIWLINAKSEVMASFVVKESAAIAPESQLGRVHE